MRGAFFLRAVGRLKPGVTVQQARDRIAIVGTELSCPISEPDRQRIGHDAAELCLKTLPGISARASLHFSPR